MVSIADLVALYHVMPGLGRSAPTTVWSGPVTYLAPPGAEGYDLRGLDDLDDPTATPDHEPPFHSGLVATGV